MTPDPATTPGVLRSEADVAATMAGRTITLDELYTACDTAGVTSRNHGHQPIAGHGADTVWRRRARNALQSLRRSGKATRVGTASWLIAGGDRHRPQRILLIADTTWTDARWFSPTLRTSAIEPTSRST